MNEQILKDIRSQEDYIWLPEMEWLDTVEANKRHKNWSNIFDLSNLEIFAIDGGGDMFAWFTGGELKDAVIFIDLVSDGGELFASDLASAIFRRIMEFASGVYTDFCSDQEKQAMDERDSEYYISESEAVDLLKEYRSRFGKYFKAEWNEILDNMISCGFKDGDSFISYEESFKAVQRLLHFDRRREFISLIRS